MRRILTTMMMRKKRATRNESYGELDTTMAKAMSVGILSSSSSSLEWKSALILLIILNDQAVSK